MSHKTSQESGRAQDEVSPPRGPGVAQGPGAGGLVDTPWDRSGRGPGARFWKMLAASAVFHLFLTPGPALLGLVAMLPAVELTEDELVEVDLTAIPVGAVAPEPTPPEPTEPEPPEPEAPPVEEPVDEAPEEPARAEEPKTDPPPTEPTPPSEPTEEAPQPTEAFGDPVALAGKAGTIADSNANVKMFLFTEVVREHPLGTKIGELLRRTPQWRDFFGPSDIDPVSDIDRVMIAGPQLRNSSEVVAVVQHKMGRERIEKAFSGLVARHGKWIDQPQLVAKARADGADRVFAAPNEEVVLVAPLSLEKQVRAMGAETKFPPSAKDVALTAYLIHPANAAKGTGIQLPPSIKWARLDLRPLPSGGAVLKILAQDESAELAADNALFFENLIRALTTVDPKSFGLLGAGLSKLGVKKKEYIKSVKFTPEGDKIHGTIEVTEKQMVAAVGFLEGYLPPAPGEEPESEPSSERGARSKREADSAAEKSNAAEEDNAAQKEKAPQQDTAPVSPEVSTPPELPPQDSKEEP